MVFLPDEPALVAVTSLNPLAEIKVPRINIVELRVVAAHGRARLGVSRRLSSLGAEGLS